MSAMDRIADSRSTEMRLNALVSLQRIQGCFASKMPVFCLGNLQKTSRLASLLGVIPTNLKFDSFILFATTRRSF
jgi:hypothetical protein